MRALDVLLAAFSLLPAAQALSPAEWRSQSIYQVVTDRFAHANGSTTVHCDLTKQDYCGGSWKGIVNKLDYIQDMGFTAVSPSKWVSLWTFRIKINGGTGLDIACCREHPE